jgi:hypothetical protein
MRVINKEYQLATWRIPSCLDHGPQLYRGFHSQSPKNFTGYSDPSMDDMLELQRRAMNHDRRETILCRIAEQINQDVPLLYRGGRRYHIISRKKIADIIDVSGLRLNFATAWIDEVVQFNALAYRIEKEASDAFDCKEPGDTDIIKAVLAGDWHGKDDWGAGITARFFEDGRVTSQRFGSPRRENQYQICGPNIFWKAGDATVRVTLTEEKIEGYWEKAGYKGTFILTKQ